MVVVAVEVQSHSPDTSVVSIHSVVEAAAAAGGHHPNHPATNNNAGSGGVHARRHSNNDFVVHHHYRDDYDHYYDDMMVMAQQMNARSNATNASTTTTVSNNNARDCSHTSIGRRHLPDDTRQSVSVNTHNSILNITDSVDDDEDDDDECSVGRHESHGEDDELLFEEMVEMPVDTSLLVDEDGDNLLVNNTAPTQSPPPPSSGAVTPTTPPAIINKTECCIVNPGEYATTGAHHNNTQNKSPKRSLSHHHQRQPTTEVAVNNSLFDLPERFVQSLCFGTSPNGGGGSNDNIKATPASSCTSSSIHSQKQQQQQQCLATKFQKDFTDYRNRLEEDIYDMLGCSSSSSSASVTSNGSQEQQEWILSQMMKPSMFCLPSPYSSWSPIGIGGKMQQQDDDDAKNNRKRPMRKSLRMRAELLNRLKSEQGLLPPQKRMITGSFSPTSVADFVRCSRSLDDRRRPANAVPEPRQLFGLATPCCATSSAEAENATEGGTEAENSGYDSDPGGLLTSSHHPKAASASPKASAELSHHLNRVDEDTSSPHTMNQLVQESLNTTWTLTWHPSEGSGSDGTDPAQQQQETNASSSPNFVRAPPLPEPPQQPMPCRVWIERGTILDGGMMLEPNLMWRQAYQPAGSRRLSTTKPCAIRLLNICRILTPPDSIIGNNSISSFDHPPTSGSTATNRSDLPSLARPSCSFVIRTSDGCGDMLFEASTPAERGDIVRSLKVVVARFATLAILEDYHCIVDEFFTTPSGLRQRNNPLFMPEDEEDDDDDYEEED